MKRKLMCLILPLFMAASLAAGCTNDNPRDVGGSGGSSQTSGDFTVSLILDGAPYVPQGTVTATWDDGFTRPYTATFGRDGVAKASGLDGDYTIRVDGLPENITYDPNATQATNYNRKIELEVYEVHELGVFTPPTNMDILFGAVELPEQGAYRLTLQSAIDEFYCLYQPTEAGMYSVSSLVDVTENAINPKYRVCAGTRFGLRTAGAILDGGGVSSTYTVNFKYDVGFNTDEMGGIIIFGVMAETRTLTFPLEVDVLVKRTGDYVRQDIIANMVTPAEFESVKDGRISKEELRARQDAFMRGNSGGKFVLFNASGALNGDNIAFNEQTGYYHLYDAQTGAYGAVVCAKITQSCGVVDLPFTAIEYVGNKALTIDDNFDKYYKKTVPKYKDSPNPLDPVYINYKIFIEGYEGLVSNMTATYGSAAQFAMYAGEYGYADFANADGVYPVTKELQRFLQGYAVSQSLFSDGNGTAETHYGVMSAEEDQWLFACGYYA